MSRAMATTWNLTRDKDPHSKDLCKRIKHVTSNINVGC